MAGWREKKARALAKVHATFEVPAVYLTHAAGTPLRLMIRVHTKTRRIENEFTWPNAPGFTDIEPTLVFRQSDMPHGKVLQESFVFVSASEIYRVGPSEPAQDGFIRASVVPARDEDVDEVVADYVSDGFGAEWDGIYP
jgi:hypothetical protein